MLDESEIPNHLIERSRKWFSSQLAQLEKQHGSEFHANRDWLCSYLNEELKELIKKTCRETTSA